jgi:hypothetical protein
MSSFRLLQTDAAAEAHLRRMAAALRPGGVYVLDLTFAAGAGEPAVTTEEAWEMTRGGVTVRADDRAVRVDDTGVEHVLAWGHDAHLRAYTVAAFAARVEAVPALQIESWHPETTRASGVSEFPLEGTSEPPIAGRTMVVLHRRSPEATLAPRLTFPSVRA